MKEKTVLVKNGLYVSQEIVNRLNPNRPKRIGNALKEEIEKVSKPYDSMQWGKRKDPSKLKPKVISNLAKIVNGKEPLDTITKKEYSGMEKKLKKIIQTWILT
jgi:hypothetical protein